MKPLYPTAIESQRRCPRRRAGRYLFRAKPLRERDWARSLGDEVHTLAEKWNKLGLAPEPDRSVADNLFIAGLPYLPQPRAGAAEIEARIELNGITYAMRRDWRGALRDLPRSEVTLATYGDMPAQLDLKTSSQPLKYGLWTRDQFLDDTQALLGALELAEASNADVVASRWLYFQTPPKDKDGAYRLRGRVEAFPSDMILGRDALGRAHLRLIEPAARAMIEQDEAFLAGQRGDARGLTDFRQLPFNPLACDDYKGRQEYGCDFVPFCTGHMPAHLNLADPARLAQFGYDAAAYNGTSTLVGPNPNLSPGAPGLAGDREHMSGQSLFQQFQNGQAPAPVLGAPAAPAFAPPPMISTAGNTFPPAQPFATQGAPVPQSMTAPVQFSPAPPAQAPAFVPTAPPPPAPVMAPAFAPPAAPVMSPPTFQGFVGVNAPEIRAMEAGETVRHVSPGTAAVQAAEGLREQLNAARPTDEQAFAALKVLRAWL